MQTRDTETVKLSGKVRRDRVTVKIADIPVKVARIILYIRCSRLHQLSNTCEVREGVANNVRVCVRCVRAW